MCRLPVTARGTGSDWLRPPLTNRAAGGANYIYIYIYIVGLVWIYFVWVFGGLSGGFTNFISFIYNTLRQSLSQFTL